VAKAIIVDSGRFLWNIDENVGLASPNQTEDVHLIQLAYHCLSTNPVANLTQAERELYGAVNPGAPYNGQPNDPLTLAIQHQQRKRGGVQDGHVSKMKASLVYGGERTWMLLPLNNNLAAVLGEHWPHIDKHPRSTAVLRELTARTFAR
jgi:hypothetical protein